MHTVERPLLDAPKEHLLRRFFLEYLLTEINLCISCKNIILLIFFVQKLHLEKGEGDRGIWTLQTHPLDLNIITRISMLITFWVNASNMVPVLQKDRITRDNH